MALSPEEVRARTNSLAGAARVFVSFPSPRILLVMFTFLLAIRVRMGGFGLLDAGVLVGITVYWPLQEWFLHVYVLHMRPFDLWGRRIDPLAAREHRRHHREPWNLETTFLPARFLLPLIPINIWLWWTVMPTPATALTGMVGFTAAAILYEWTHYLTHTKVRPRWGYFANIVRRHRLHHFKNEHYWHAFTVPAVDDLMGTAPPVDEVERSPTCRTLEYEDEV